MNKKSLILFAIISLSCLSVLGKASATPQQVRINNNYSFDIYIEITNTSTTIGTYFVEANGFFIVTLPSAGSYTYKASNLNSQLLATQDFSTSEGTVNIGGQQGKPSTQPDYTDSILTLVGVIGTTTIATVVPIVAVNNKRKKAAEIQ